MIQVNQFYRLHFTGYILQITFYSLQFDYDKKQDFKNALS